MSEKSFLMINEYLVYGLLQGVCWTIRRRGARPMCHPVILQWVASTEDCQEVTQPAITSVIPTSSRLASYAPHLAASTVYQVSIRGCSTRWFCKLRIFRHFMGKHESITSKKHGKIVIEIIIKLLNNVQIIELFKKCKKIIKQWKLLLNNVRRVNNYIYKDVQIKFYSIRGLVYYKIISRVVQLFRLWLTRYEFSCLKFESIEISKTYIYMW